jgi:hypothetical protein
VSNHGITYREYKLMPALHRAHGNTGVCAQVEDERKARAGSLKLRDAVLRAIIGHADAVRTDIDTAAAFLLSGRR